MVDKIKTKVILPKEQLPKSVRNREYSPFLWNDIRFTADKEKGYVADKNSVFKIGLGNLQLRFGRGEYADFYLLNSLHKLCHEGYNHTDFTQSQLIDTVDHISTSLGIEANMFKLNGQVELAVNIPVQDANGIISSCFGFKGLSMDNMKDKQNNYGKKAFGSKYNVKVYNPILKLKYEGCKLHHDNNDLLRFEIAVQKYYINSIWGIPLHTLKDFQNKAILRDLGAKLVEMSKGLKFEPVFPIDLKPQDLQKYLYFRKGGATKEQIIFFREHQHSTYKRHRAIYNRLQKRYGQSYSIVEAVAQKWDFLLNH